MPLLLQPVTKTLKQLYETQFIRVFSIKIPPPPPQYLCFGSVICPQDGLSVICRPINIDQRVEEEEGKTIEGEEVGKIFAKSGCLNIFCDWLS